MAVSSSSVAAIFDVHSSGLPQYKAVSAQKKRKDAEMPSRGSSSGGYNPGPEAVPRGTRRRPSTSSSASKVDTRSNRTVFVGNIPASCTKRHIKQLLKPYGSIQSIRLRSIKVVPGDQSTRLARRTGKQLVEGSSFNAYVVVSSQTEAENCLHLNGALFRERHLRVDIIREKEELDKAAQRSAFIGNLPFSADEEKLRKVFSICGQIENVRIVRDPSSGQGKGFGFVTFVDSSGVMFAVKQHHKATLDGRTLRVCRTKNQQSLQEEKQAKLSGIRCNERSTSGVRKAGPLRAEKTTKLSGGASIGKRNADGTKNRHRRLAISS